MSSTCFEPSVHLQEEGCIYSYGTVRCTFLPFPARDRRLVFPFQPGTRDSSSLSSQGQETRLPFPARDKRLAFLFQPGTGDSSSLSSQGQETRLPFPARDRRLVFPLQPGTADLSLKVVRGESKTKSFVI